MKRKVVGELLRRAQELSSDAAATHETREDRLRKLGYDEPSDEERRDNLNRNVALLWLLGSLACAPNDDGYLADYDDARRATVDAWEYVIGPVSAACRARAKAAVVVESDAAGFPSACYREATRLNGCHVPVIGAEGARGDQIYITEDRAEIAKADTAIEEFTHLLAECETGDSDADHINPLYWEDYGTETVEALGCAGLVL